MSAGAREAAAGAPAPARRAVPLFRAALAVLGKDLAAERRTREVINTSLPFAMIVPVIFAFAFEPTMEETRQFAGGLLWVVITFAGVLALNRSFARDLPNDALLGLLAAPVSPAAVYLGKTMATALFMVVIELMLLPLFALFYNLPLLSHAGKLAMLLALGTWGFAVLGTLLAAMTVTVRTRDLLLPILLFPLLTPLLIAAMEATTAVLGGQPWRAWQLWVKALAGFDLIFTVASVLLVEYVLEN